MYGQTDNVNYREDGEVTKLRKIKKGYTIIFLNHETFIKLSISIFAA